MSDTGPTIATLKAEIDFLDAELTAAKAEIERLREWNAEIALNAREFAADNERLRAALKSCIAMLEQLGYTPISKVARAALEGRT